MNNFKQGDIVVLSGVGNSAWHKTEVMLIGEVDTNYYSFKIIKNPPYEGFKLGGIYEFVIYPYQMEYVNTLTKEEMLIRKIQWLYKNSPSSFEKRWVKNES